MAYSEGLAQRIRKVLAGQEGLSERKMFGGIAFMLRGNMCCGILKDELILRLGPEQVQEALRKRNTRVFDFSHRPNKGQ
jgi:TfoX/Sxy family transcriptional regulator of competence genes